MSELTKVQIDLSTGMVTIEAPVEALDTIFDRLESFVPQLAGAYRNSLLDEGEEEQSIEEPQNKSLRSTKESKDESVSKPAASKRRGSSKKETYEIVDLGLDIDQRQSFREFYKSKKPKKQSDEVISIIFWLNQNAHISQFTPDEIYSSYKILDIKVPARISSVMRNLKLDGKLLNPEPNKFTLHHTGEDYVKYSLSPEKDEN